MPRESTAAPYLTYMFAIVVFLNAFLPTEEVKSSNSAQLLVKLADSHPLLLEAGSHEAGAAHPDELQTVQSGGAPASLLATKHAKPTIQMNGEARYGTAVRLPQTTQLSCTHGLVLPLAL